MKKLATLIALAALAAGCTATDNTNMARTGNASNTAVVVPNNANMTANANTRAYDPNITEADYEKNKESYAGKAKAAGDTIGSGLKDGWLWTKTKGSLAAVDDLRDSTINVDVDNGVITLRGTVANAAQKAAAMKAANGIEGKKNVKDMLKLAADGGPTNANANHSGNGNHK